MKKRIGIMLALMVIMTQCLGFAAYVDIYESYGELENLADGVTKQTIMRYTSEGWLNINVVRANLNEQMDLTVLTDSYLSSRDTLSNLLDKNNEDHSVVAAINSDFFDTANNTTMGNLVRDGKVLTTSVGSNEFASFNVTKDNLPYIGYINSPNNSFTNGTYTQKLTYINKPYLSYDRSILFTTDWATTSYGKTLDKDILELLVVDDVVKEIRRMGNPFTIPENGYVIACVGADIGAVQTHFKVGDKLILNYDVNFRFMDLSIGGGAQIVSNGKVIENFSQNISGKHPRSAVGITKDRKQIIMVTIDGRTTAFRGVTQTELGQIMIGLGAYEAINLDGGGSSQMVIQSPWEDSPRTVNYPSDGSERKMYTGLAIAKVLSETPTLLKAKIDMESPNLVLGTKTPIELRVIDSNYVPVTVDASKVQWELTGIEGSIKDGFLVASGTGAGKIKAEYNGLVAEGIIHVYDNAVKLNVSPAVIKVDKGENKALTFSVTTSDGKTIELSSDSVKATVPEMVGAYDAETGSFQAGNQVQQAVVTFEFNGLKTYIPAAVGTQKSILATFETPTGKFVGYPETVKGRYREIPMPKNGAQAGLIEYDFSASSDTRAAYVEFNEPIELPDNTQSIGLWAFGDYGNDHWLRGKVTDAKGNSTNITFSRHVDWEGWKYLTAELPANFEQPAQLNRVYLVETDGELKDSGTILIDDITAVIGQKIIVQVPENVTKIKAAEAYELPSTLKTKAQTIAFSEKATDLFKEAILKNAKATIQVDSSAAYTTVKLNNVNNSIRTNGYKQWVKLIEMAGQTQQKPVVVIMNDINKFSDKYEGELLMTELSKIQSQGVDVCVIYPTTAQKYNIQTVNGISVISVPRIQTELKGVKLAAEGKKLYFEVIK